MSMSACGRFPERRRVKLWNSSMNFRLFFLAVLLMPFLYVSAGAPFRLTAEGVELDAGTMGKFTFRYPGFDTGERRIAPEVKLDGGRVRLTYLAERAPEIELTLDGGRLHGRMKTAAAGKLIWEMFLPIMAGGRFEWAFEPGGARGVFPKEQPPKPHLAQRNGSRFRCTDPRSAESFSIALEGDGFWELQDNREWKWKIFQLKLYTDVLSNRAQEFTLEFQVGRPAALPVRVDRFGQPKTLDFPGKIKDEAELKADLSADRAYYDSLTPPPVAAWGGMPGSREKFRLKATGFFRLDKVRGRDVLVTPEGDLFFQLGVCTVSPGDDYTYIRGREQIYEWLPRYESEYQSAFRGHWATDFSFYLANRIRKTGRPHELDGWKKEQIFRLRKWGFNSDGAFTAYTPVNRAEKFGRTPELYKYSALVGDIGDPFDDETRRILDEKYAAIAAFREDPTIIGYFLANEQPYGDLLRKVPGFDGRTAAKRELVKLLERQYGVIDRFNAAWNLKASDFAALNDLPLPVQTPAAREDMERFSRHFFDAYFGLIARTFRKYDPNHLLLGARFLPANVGVEAAVEACGRYCDVFSINYYTRSIEPEFLEKVHRLSGRPLLLSEWSYGTAEQGLAGGVIDTRNQVERGYAYRSYAETAASLPFVVGCQWFAYLDQALTGRYFQHYNGECMNIGLINVADRPFKEFLAEAMKTNYRIYELKLGEAAPFSWRDDGHAGNRPLKSLQIPRALPGHKVDGVKTPWPGRPSERLDGSCLVVGADAGGSGADFWLCWDERYLYLYAEVMDATPARNSRRGGELWQSDCLELFIGGESPERAGPLLFTDRQLLLSAGAPDGGSWFVNQPEQPEVQVVIVPRGDGYSVEAGIPWKALQIKPEPGRRFRFDLGLDDGNDGPRRLRQFMWSGTADNSAVRTRWGNAVLVD